MTKNKRCIVTIDDDTLEALKKIKKEQYFDKPHSELYRDLFRLGIAAMERSLLAQKNASAGKGVAAS